MAITHEDVAALAHLARVGLEKEETERAERELENILGYVDRLQKIDTTGVEEAAPEPVAAHAFRVDEVTACSDKVRAEIIQNFPASQSGFLKAPAVFERPKS
ncbi:MAG: Glutamyl-tRNA(Gln) amidotransferase subunit [Candidatus Parcubacteria bacterium]|jgi:aspartyl-tRNA(Asn)/glutamyl-tRNA(Gln) amidotransferase subunit C